MARDAAPRGSTILNSVNSPGFVSTLIVPACCFTTMSWLIDRPRPVPSPGRFGREERIEHLLLHVGRNACAVVAYPDLDPVAEVRRRSLQHRLIGTVWPRPHASWWRRSRSRSD